MQTPDINIPDLLTTMAAQTRAFLAARGRDNPAMIGIHTGGVWIADALHGLLDSPDALGHMSVAFYRDDFDNIGLHQHGVTPPFDVNGRHIILVDDVLHTGRTIRAALNELFDYGRPASVTLAVLVARANRELPIQADIVGLNLDLPYNTQVKLHGPDNLQLDVIPPS